MALACTEIPVVMKKDEIVSHFAEKGQKVAIVDSIEALGIYCAKHMAPKTFEATLTITVKSGQGWKDKDSGLRGTSDPYMICCIEGVCPRTVKLQPFLCQAIC